MSAVVLCPRCNRSTSLRRTSCIYCGETLPVTDAATAVQVPILRTVEEWERGYSVILAPLDLELTARQLERLCEIARLPESEARSILEARTPLPVARVPSLEDADLVARLLAEADMGTSIVADADLDLDRASHRVSELRMEEDALQLLVLWKDWVSIRREDLVCAVEGHLVSNRVDIVETPKRSKREIVGTSEFFSESFTVDVYGPTIESSFRIRAERFDFTCLGGRPAPFVEANVNRLRTALAGYLGASRYDASFRRVSRLLDHAWPPASRVASRGLGRQGDFRKYSVSSVETDPLAQFTRFSRTRFVLATR
jgi:hypothetical protein